MIKLKGLVTEKWWADEPFEKLKSKIAAGNSMGKPMKGPEVADELEKIPKYAKKANRIRKWKTVQLDDLMPFLGFKNWNN